MALYETLLYKVNAGCCEINFQWQTSLKLQILVVVLVRNRHSRSDHEPPFLTKNRSERIEEHP